MVSEGQKSSNALTGLWPGRANFIYNLQSTIHIVQSAIDNPQSTCASAQSYGTESEPVMTVEQLYL